MLFKHVRWTDTEPSTMGFFSTPALSSVVEKPGDGQLKNWIFFHGKTCLIGKLFKFPPNEIARLSRICLKNLFLT